MRRVLGSLRNYVAPKAVVEPVGVRWREREHGEAIKPTDHLTTSNIDLQAPVATGLLGVVVHGGWVLPYGPVLHALQGRECHVGEFYLDRLPVRARYENPVRCSQGDRCHA